MAYALTNGRQNYTAIDIELAFRELDTSLSGGANLNPNTGNYEVGSVFGKTKKGVPLFGAQPVPHAGIHGADELHNHPLFAKARMTTMPAFNPAHPAVHSTMDHGAMVTALVTAFNNPAMQPFLATLDGAATSVNVNVNYNAAIGTCNIFTQTAIGSANENLGAAAVCLVLKLRKNPNNATVPIIQTAIPYAAHQMAITKKGAIVGLLI